MTATLRVMTYNVRSLRDDSRAVADVIRDAAPDVLCLQEVPRFLSWRRKCRRLARRSGLRIATGGRSAAATMVMVRPELGVLATRDVRLPKGKRLHERGLAMAVLDTAIGRVCVASTHMSLDDDERVAHLRSMLAELRRVQVPLVLAGDVNETPDGPVWHALAARYTDAWSAAGDGDGFTYSADVPVRRIDGVFVSPALMVLSAEVPASGHVAAGSDHRPVVVALAAAAPRSAYAEE